jgi:hypothetical protein
MTYYTFPRLFKHNNSVINYIQIKYTKRNKEGHHLHDKLLHILSHKTDGCTHLKDIKEEQSNDMIRQYQVCFSEINKVCKIFQNKYLVYLHMSNEYDILSAFKDMCRGDNKYIYISDIYHEMIPEDVKYHNIRHKNDLEICISKYKSSIDHIYIDNNDIDDKIVNFLLSLIFQKEGGNLVIKVDKLTTLINKEIIFILMSLYDNVLIVRPKISKIIIDSRYIVASKKICETTLSKNFLLNLIYDIKDKNKLELPSSILNFDIPQLLSNKIDECELIINENILNMRMKSLSINSNI